MSAVAGKGHAGAPVAGTTAGPASRDTANSEVASIESDMVVGKVALELFPEFLFLDLFAQRLDQQFLPRPHIECLQDSLFVVFVFQERVTGQVHQQLRVFQEALEMLPEGVTKVYLRSDTAGYEHHLLRYCETGQNKRFGRIEFAIGMDVTSEFKKAVAEVQESEWKPLWKEIEGERIRANTEWAEVCFVPNAISRSKKDPVYRYLATRELLEQPELPGMEDHREVPFPTMSMQKKRYKIFGIVTNRDVEGSELINWLHKRCGKSEEAHSIMKEDLAGGKLPSSDFGDNAAWWWIMILAFNLNSAMKRLVLEESWAARRMKAIRFSLIGLPGRVLDHARGLIIRLVKDHPSLEILVNARQRIMEFGCMPSG